MAATDAPPAVAPRGIIEPRLWAVPPRDSDDAGREAVAFYRRMTGRVVLPWQELAVIEIMAERWVPADGQPYTDPFTAIASGRAGAWKWAASNAALILARQNGKGEVLLIIELYHLFVLKARRIFHTAQLQRTASDAHARMVKVIRESPKLLAQLRGGERGIRYGKGDERIVTADSREIIFFTRSNNAGRGLFGDLLIVDEAYDATPGEMAAIRPLIKTARAPQVIFTSTPVDEEVMPNGMVLAEVRKRALAGAERTLLLEWSVPEREKDPATGRYINARDERLVDLARYAPMANPSLGWDIEPGVPLVDFETIVDDLPGMGQRKFAVEDLCVPDYWPDPDLTGQEEVPFDAAEFERAARRVALMDPVVLGVDRSPDGRTCLTAAGWHTDGTWGSETLVHRQGTEWLIPAVKSLMGSCAPAILVLDAAGPAGALVAKLQAEKIECIVTGIQEMGRACQALVDDYEEGSYVPPAGDIPLATAVEVARWRPLGDARAFARKGYGDISPLVATALAGFGLSLVVAFAKPKKDPLTPEALPPAPGSGADWAAAGAGAGYGAWSSAGAEGWR